MKKFLFTVLFSIFSLISFTQVNLTQWIPSDNGTSAYNKGRFFYKIIRSQYPTKIGYRYEIQFISDSYYAAPFYDSNRNGIIESYEIYRSSTKIDRVSLYVNGSPYKNSLTNTNTFWLLFRGDFQSGVGETGIVFYSHLPNCKIYIRWTQPKPY
jgi:hypothetical protein